MPSNYYHSPLLETYVIQAALSKRQLMTHSHDDHSINYPDINWRSFMNNLNYSAPIWQTTCWASWPFATTFFGGQVLETFPLRLAAYLSFSVDTFTRQRLQRPSFRQFLSKNERERWYTIQFETLFCRTASLSHYRVWRQTVQTITTQIPTTLSHSA